MRESDTYFFEAKGIKKAFGGTQALKSAQLQVKKGEVLALLGENGAGKSTLMKIIIGLERADAGEMFIDGKPYIARGPIEAMHAGISMIHQELNTEPYLTVAENIFLNREDTKGIFLDKKETVRKTKKLMEDFGFSIHPETEMGKLSIAEAQMVEIIKAASCNAKMVIMDEPTSSLDNAETERLFKIIADLKSKGVSIIYISHRLEEIYKIADRAAVFRDGEYITTQEIEGLSQSQIISYMVGHEVKDLYPKVEADIGDVVLEVKNLSGKGFTDISFKVRKGEILGFSGLVGAGRSETMRAIFGLDPIKSGEIFLEGKKIKIDSTAKAIDHGIAMANEDRKTYGLCLFRSLKENIALPTLRQFQKGYL